MITNKHLKKANKNKNDEFYTQLTDIEKVYEKNRLTQALEKSSPEQIDRFTDMLRKNMQKFLERGPTTQTKDKGKNKGIER